MLKNYICNYTIDRKQYTQIIQANSTIEAKRIVNGQLQNIGKTITHFQTKESR